MDPLYKIKSHKFYGKKYKFQYGKLKKLVSKKDMTACSKSCNIKPSEMWALTDPPDKKDKKIIVSDDITDPKELLRVLLDEAFHALDFKTDNDVVAEYACDLASFLWRCGYRRIISTDVLNNNQKREEE